MRFPATLLLFVGLCSLTPLRAADAAARSAGSDRHPLWRVEGQSNVVYVLGAVHILKSSHYPLAPVIETAFSNSSVAVFETDVNEMDSPATRARLLAKSKLPGGETLKDVLSPEVYDAFNRRLTNSGLPRGSFDVFKPSMAGLMLIAVQWQKLGIDAEFGVDRHFFDLAVQTGKKIVALESVDFQIDLVMGLTREEGELMMKSALKDLDNTEKNYGEIVSAWAAGDGAKLESLLNDGMRDAPDLKKRMLTDRTERWVPKVEELLRGNRNAIVIVGAGHIVGDNGLIVLLQKNGWKTKQL
jgi:uncharacterized protein YbaP (TraB family)